MKYEKFMYEIFAVKKMLLLIITISALIRRFTISRCPPKDLNVHGVHMMTWTFRMFGLTTYSLYYHSVTLYFFNVYTTLISKHFNIHGFYKIVFVRRLHIISYSISSNVFNKTWYEYYSLVTWGHHSSDHLVVCFTSTYEIMNFLPELLFLALTPTFINVSPL